MAENIKAKKQGKDKKKWFMIPKKPKPEAKRTIRIQVGLTDSDLNSLQEDALDVQMSLADLMYYILMNKSIYVFSTDIAETFRKVASVSNNLSQITSMKNIESYMPKAQVSKLCNVVETLNFIIEEESKAIKKDRISSDVYEEKPGWFIGAKSRNKVDKRCHRWKVGVSAEEKEKLIEKAGNYKLPLATYIYRVIIKRPMRLIVPVLPDSFYDIAKESAGINRITSMYNLTHRLTDKEVRDLVEVTDNISVLEQKEVEYLKSLEDVEIQ